MAELRSGPGSGSWVVTGSCSFSLNHVVLTVGRYFSLNHVCDERVTVTEC